MSDGQSDGASEPRTPAESAPPSAEPPPGNTPPHVPLTDGERSPEHVRAAPTGRYLALLSIGALGVVYGDIGTSPIYAIRESLAPEHEVAVTSANVLGVLSLIFWALVIIIAIKYQIFVLRANNRGEGGILALTGLISAPGRTPEKSVLMLLGLFGAALLYGDTMLTPAVSVLSAAEGLSLISPGFEPFVLPMTIGILLGLFLLQKRGTAGVGALFAPVMVVWFLTIGLLGLTQIVRNPATLFAVNPAHAVTFFTSNGWTGFVVLGSVFLAVTGGEALYADMGHFGVRPIRLMWFSLVMPALLLNYFGQGALILSNPAAAANPFFLLAPSWGLIPLVALTTAATIIASQAVISGAFSLTMQAVQLGYLPRVVIEHTSEREHGQIYVPAVNWVLMVACIGLVLGFRSSSNLAAAYGVAVTTTMVITTILFGVMARERWKWALPVLLLLEVVFLSVDLAFWGANMLRVPRGGWFPLAIATVVLAVMTTWSRGREILARRMAASTLPVEFFLADLTDNPPRRTPGTGIFMARGPDGTPPALLHTMQHFGAVPERVVILSVLTAQVPRFEGQRIEAKELGDGFHRVVMRYGFMEDPDVARDLEENVIPDLDLDLGQATFFLGRETVIASEGSVGMSAWRERLFGLMARNARLASSFFHLPSDRVVELGVQVEL
ncbi:MAG: potassium transporter Kup [Gemmatimonadales bacterium]